MLHELTMLDYYPLEERLREELSKLRVTPANDKVRRALECIVDELEDSREFGESHELFVTSADDYVFSAHVEDRWGTAMTYHQLDRLVRIVERAEHAISG